jgi:hypothetical protein
METKTSDLLLTLGFILSLGSIFSFIIMNAVLNNSASSEAIYWQRLFVSKMTQFLIMPGICLIIIGSVLYAIKRHNFFGDFITGTFHVLIIMIVINSINILLIEEKATAMVIYRKLTIIGDSEFLNMKRREDIFGGINVLMLLSALFIFIFKRGK